MQLLWHLPYCCHVLTASTTDTILCNPQGQWVLLGNTHGYQTLHPRHFFLFQKHIKKMDLRKVKYLFINTTYLCICLHSAPALPFSLPTHLQKNRKIKNHYKTFSRLLLASLDISLFTAHPKQFLVLLNLQSWNFWDQGAYFVLC